MSQPGKTTCFTCGQAIGEKPKLNTLDSGEICPGCRDRVLESLPTLLPGANEEREVAPEPVQTEFGFEETRFYPLPGGGSDDDRPIGA